MPKGRRLLVWSVALGSQLWAATVLAQPSPPAAGEATATAPAQTKLGEEITVTGSRIRRKDLTTPAPVAVFSTQVIEQSGNISLGEFLSRIPETYNSLNTQVNNGGTGTVKIDLRGLTAQRTLVLVNGRRMVEAGAGGYGTGVDINTIPLAAVERIEVLKDGASAIYGSDAIAGVVNVITKRKYEGVEAHSQFGLSSRGDGFQFSVDSTGGASNDKGSFMVSLMYTQQQSIMAGDREWSNRQYDYDFTTGDRLAQGSSSIPNTRFYKSGAAGAGNAAWQGLLAANPNASSFMWDSAVTGTAYGPYRPYSSAKDTYNFQPANYIQTPNSRLQAFSSGEYTLSESVPTRAFYQAIFTLRGSKYQLAPDPLVIGPSIGGVEAVYSAQNAFNPFGTDISILRQRMVGFGPRTEDDTATTAQVTAGLAGTIPGINWGWDAALSYGFTNWSSVNRGLLWVSRLQNAIGPSSADGTKCLDSAGNAIAGCVPLDMFHGPNAVNPAAAAYLSPAMVNRIQNELTQVNLNASGELPMRLFADRPLALAVGYAYEFNMASDTPDSLMASGQVDNQNRQATLGYFYSNQGYGELSLPIVNNRPFLENLEGTAAVRYVNYSTFGTNWSYKFGVRYTPVRDATFRGTYSTAFRAPSTTDLYQGATESFPTAKDPCADLSGASATRIAACQKDGVPAGGTGFTGETQQRATIGGNPKLQPETATTWTAGVVLEPRWVKNLSITADYYWVKISNVIQPFGTQYILDQCYPTSGTRNDTFCNALIKRDPTTGGLSNVTDVAQNTGEVKTNGLDFAIRWLFPTELGRWGLAYDATYLLAYDDMRPGGQTYSYKGNTDGFWINNGLGGLYPDYKHVVRANWTKSGFNAGANWRFISSMKQCADTTGFSALGGVCYNNPTGLYRMTGTYNSFDLFLGYVFQNPAGTSSVTVGVNNILDAAPTTIYMGLAPNSDPTNYDYIGRYFYLRLGHKL